jgi:hypothetical protein
VNKTPSNIPRVNQQAFTPAVAVAANGNVAVTYYDLRNPDNQSGGLPTDFWIVFGHPDQDLTNPDNWVSEQRMTKASFNMELAPVARGYFVGDYTALNAGGESPNSFSALFGMAVSSSDPSSIFFRDPALDDSPPALSPSLFASGENLQRLDEPGPPSPATPWQAAAKPLEVAHLGGLLASGSSERRARFLDTQRFSTPHSIRSTPEGIWDSKKEGFSTDFHLR